MTAWPCRIFPLVLWIHKRFFLLLFMNVWAANKEKKLYIYFLLTWAAELKEPLFRQALYCTLIVSPYTMNAFSITWECWCSSYVTCCKTETGVNGISFLSYPLSYLSAELSFSCSTHIQFLLWKVTDKLYFYKLHFSAFCFQILTLILFTAVQFMEKHLSSCIHLTSTDLALATGSKTFMGFGLKGFCMFVV